MPTQPTRRFLLLANPTAGRGGAAERMEAVAGLLRAAGAPVTTHQTSSTDDATARASAASGAGEIAVALGGDGLARAVARGVAGHGGVMGIIPSGRGNDFARWAALPEEPKAAAELLLTGNPRPIDGIHVSGPGQSEPAFALGNVYLGFDSLSNVAANRQRLPWGRFAYSVAALRWPSQCRCSTCRSRSTARWCSGRARASRSPTARSTAARSPSPRGRSVRWPAGSRALRADATRRPRGDSAGTPRRQPCGPPWGTAAARTEIEVRVSPAVEAYADGDPIATVPFRASVQPRALQLLLP